MTTEQRVISIVADKLGYRIDEIFADGSLINDYGADSLDTIELVWEIEREFNFEIEEEKIETIKRVSDIIKIVNEKLQPHAPTQSPQDT